LHDLNLPAETDSNNNLILFGKKISGNAQFTSAGRLLSHGTLLFNADLEYLKERGIGAAVYYPLPLHLQPCFRYLGYREGELPHAERAAREVLSLPVFPELTEEEQETVIKEIRSFYER